MSLVELNFYAKSLSRNVSVSVVLPYGNWEDMTEKEVLDKRDEKYPVLYLLHGYQGDHLSWLRNSEVEKFSERTGFIVVLPAGENSFYVDLPELKLNMESFVTGELRWYIEHTFPCKIGRDNRAIAGLSMGAYGALRLGFLYPQLYCAIGAFSPPYVSKDLEISSFFHSEYKYASELCFGKADTWEHSSYDLFYLAQNYKTKLESNNLESCYIYLACGEQDSLLPGNRKMNDILSTSGLDYSYTEGSGGHIWSYWNRHLSRFMAKIDKRINKK